MYFVHILRCTTILKICPEKLFWIHFTRYQQEHVANQPIIFTKFKPEPKFVENRVVQEEEGTLIERDHNKPMEFTLPKNVVENIHNYVEKYERHLRKTSHQVQGKFDPWKLVEE